MKEKKHLATASTAGFFFPFLFFSFLCVCVPRSVTGVGHWQAHITKVCTTVGSGSGAVSVFALSVQSDGTRDIKGPIWKQAGGKDRGAFNSGALVAHLGSAAWQMETSRNSQLHG